MEIQWTKRSLRDFKELQTEVQKSVRKAVESLENWPNVKGVKNLKKRDDYRIRTGDHRVFFEVIANTIYITKVERRNENTYK